MNTVENCRGISAAFLKGRLIRAVLLAITFCVAGAASAGAAQSVTLAWDPSPDLSVAGYFVHYGTVSRTYTGLVDTGGTTVGTVEGLQEGQTYYFTVTAYNQQRIESAPSGEIAYTVPDVTPTPVAGLLRILRGAGLTGLPQLQFQVPPTYQYEIQASEDLKSWKTIHQSISLSTNWTEYVDPEAVRLPKRFYRLALPDVPQAPGIISMVRGAVPPGATRLRPEVTQGQRYEIQTSEDLVSWKTVHEGICVSSEPMDFVDAQAGLFQNRFYRLVLPDNPLLSSVLTTLHGEISSGARLRVGTVEGQPYRIEASQDMATWATLHEGVGHSTEFVDLIDREAGLHSKRFYRLAFD